MLMGATGHIALTEEGNQDFCPMIFRSCKQISCMSQVTTRSYVRCPRSLIPRLACHHGSTYYLSIYISLPLCSFHSLAGCRLASCHSRRSNKVPRQPPHAMSHFMSSDLASRLHIGSRNHCLHGLYISAQCDRIDLNLFAHSIGGTNGEIRKPWRGNAARAARTSHQQQPSAR